MTESAHNEIQQQIGDLVKRELFEVN